LFTGITISDDINAKANRLNKKKEVERFIKISAIFTLYKIKFISIQKAKQWMSHLDSLVKQ